MRVLIACEEWGRVRQAFRAKGHDAWSCDILPSRDNDIHHIQDDARNVVNWSWEMIIGFPPCTYLSKATNGAVFYDEAAREAFYENRRKALKFAIMIYNACPIVAIENPEGSWLNQLWRKADQTIQPYWFGDPWTKGTSLWLKGLPTLSATNWVGSKGSWMTQTRKPEFRARTFSGVAEAMAMQWG